MNLIKSVLLGHHLPLPEQGRGTLWHLPFARLTQSACIIVTVRPGSGSDPDSAEISAYVRSWKLWPLGWTVHHTPNTTAIQDLGYNLNQETIHSVLMKISNSSVKGVPGKCQFDRGALSWGVVDIGPITSNEIAWTMSIPGVYLTYTIASSGTNVEVFSCKSLRCRYTFTNITMIGLQVRGEVNWGFRSRLCLHTVTMWLIYTNIAPLADLAQPRNAMKWGVGNKTGGVIRKNSGFHHDVEHDWYRM